MNALTDSLLATDMLAPFEVDVQLSMQDLFLVRLIQFTRKPLLVTLLAAVMLFTLVLFLISAGNGQPSYAMLAEFCLLGVLIPIMLFWNTRSYYKGTKQLQEPLHYVVAQTHISVASIHYTSVLNYSDAWKIQEVTEYFLFWETPMTVHMLPKRYLKGESNIQYVRKLLAVAQPSKGVHLKKG